MDAFVKFVPITEPPVNHAEFTLAARATEDAGLEFVKNLARMLQRGTPHICTPEVPQDWVLAALIGSQVRGYEVREHALPTTTFDAAQRGKYYFTRTNGNAIAMVTGNTTDQPSSSFSSSSSKSF